MTQIRLVVRAARPEDAAEVRRLSIAFTPAAQEVPPEVFDSRFARFLADASWCLPVAPARTRLLGYGLAQDFGPGLRADFTTGRVHDVFVDPDSRLAGTGRALMNFIFDWSRARPQPMILDWQASPSSIARRVRPREFRPSGTGASREFLPVIRGLPRRRTVPTAPASPGRGH